MELKKIHISDIGKIVTGKTPRTSVAENYDGYIPPQTTSLISLPLKRLRHLQNKD